MRRALAFAMGLVPEVDAGPAEGEVGPEEPAGHRAAGGGPEVDAGEDAVMEVLDARGYREERTVGQYRNTIIIMTATLKRAGDIRAFWESFRTRDPGGIARLAGQLEERLDDELVLHLRFAKQDAYLGRLRLSSGSDTVAVRLKPRVYTGGREAALASLGAFLE